MVDVIEVKVWENIADVIARGGKNDWIGIEIADVID